MFIGLVILTLNCHCTLIVSYTRVPKDITNLPQLMHFTTQSMIVKLNKQIWQNIILQVYKNVTSMSVL